MPKFTKKDFASDTWARLTEHLNIELEAARTSLESKLISPDVTAALRGDIARIRSLLALRKADPEAAPGSRSGNQVDDVGE